MMKKYILLAACSLGLSLTGCNDFLDYTPTAVVDEDKAFSEPEKMVNAAYAMLGDCWYTYPFNLFPYGDVSSDDCLKGGSGTTDTGYHAFDIWTTLTSTTPGEMDELWYRLYVAVSRCNRALIALERNGDSLGQDVKQQRIAEVRFLRGHFYFKLLTVFRQIPWIDEQVVEDNSYEQVSNTALSYEQLFQNVIEDFQAAYDYRSVVIPARKALEMGAQEVLKMLPKAKNYYVTIDIDGYDMNTAPGVGSPSPGGLNYVFEPAVLEGIAKMGNVVGCDLVEVAPKYDPTGITPRLGAMTMLAFMGFIMKEREMKGLLKHQQA